jgi:hypothetical protein
MELAKSSKPQLGFVEKALESLESALVYAEGLVKSGMLPKHYYENGKPKDGSAQACLLVIQMGKEVGMSDLQAIQQIVPVNNTLSIKGDGAKALIMSSGLCDKWVEEEVGQGDNFGFKITASRKDTKETKTATFTILEAKRAGLWITDEAASRNGNLKYSAWYKYPKRMLKYRALGFLCRDLFPDVLQGMVTLEEAEDYGKESLKVEAVTNTGVQVSTNADLSVQEKMEDAALKSASRSRTATAAEKKTEPKKEEVAPPVQEPKVVETKIQEPSFENKLEALTDESVVEFISKNKDAVLDYLNQEFKKQGFDSLTNFLEFTKTKSTLRIAGIILMYMKPNGSGYKALCLDHFGQVVFPELEQKVPAEASEIPQTSEMAIPEAPRDFDGSGYVLELISKAGKDSVVGETFAITNGYKDFQDFLDNAPSVIVERFINS